MLDKNSIVRIAKNLIEWVRTHKTPIITMSAVVVMVTTYALILPALTLEADKAAEQGGIDVPQAEETVSRDEDGAEADGKDSAQEAEQNHGAKENAKSTDSTEEGDKASSSKQSPDTDAEGTAKEASDKGEGSPAMSFHDQLKKQGEKTETKAETDAESSEMLSEISKAAEEDSDVLLDVKVEAEAGAFPAGTTMNLKEAASDDKLKEKVEQAAENAEILRAVDITFTDPDGKETEPAKKVKVTFTSNAVADMDAKDPVVVHVPDTGAAEVLGRKDDSSDVTIDKDKNEVTFQTDQFSTYVIAGSSDNDSWSINTAIDTSDAAEEQAGAISDADDANITSIVSKLRAGSPEPVNNGTGSGGSSGSALNLSTYLKTSGVANSWQTVNREYAGNTTGNKDGYDSADSDVKNDVMIQKDVVGTGTENEFYVYLSVDKPMSVGELLQGASIAISTNNNRAVGSAYAGLQGRNDIYVAENSGGQNAHRFTVNLYDTVTYDKKGNETLGTLLYSYTTMLYGNETPQCSNGSIYVQIPYDGTINTGSGSDHSREGYAWLTLASGVNLKPTTTQGSGSAATLNLGLSGNSVLQHLRSTYTSLDKVTDTLGDNITFLGVQDCDGSYEYSDGIITWTPVENDYIRSNQSVSASSENWYRNVIQMVYKVRLDVQPEKSCADTLSSKSQTTSEGDTYAVNRNAVLDYRQAKKATTLDDGLTFILEDYTPYFTAFQVPTVRGLLYDIKLLKVSQDTAGYNALPGVEFSLSGAGNNGAVTYDLTGTSGPDGYVTWMDDDELMNYPGVQWGDYTVSETSAPTGYQKVQDQTYNLCYTTNASDLAVNGDHMIYRGGQSGNAVRVVNKRNKITFTKSVTAVSPMQTSKIDHTIYIALTYKDENNNDKYLTDSSGNIIYKTVTVTNGIVSGPVTFDGVEDGLENIKYDIRELASVNGSEAVMLGVGDIISSDGEDYQLSAVTGNNDADLRSTNEAAVALTNKYSYPDYITFTAHKRWRDAQDNDITEDSSAAKGQVVFAIYQNDAAAPFRTVTLDGTVDDPIGTDGGETSAWTAEFRNLPNYDNSGNKYRYKVIETSWPDEFYRVTDVLPDASNGGWITNKQKTTSIVIKKVKNDVSHAFLPGSSFELSKYVNGTYSLVQAFSIDDTESAGEMISSLTSGTYRLVETHAPDGYVILSGAIQFTVDATGTSDVIAWAGGRQPENVLPLSGTGNNTITVVNTPGTELPSTGGPGDRALYIGGMALIVMALAGLLMKRRIALSTSPPDGSLPDGYSARFGPGVSGTFTSPPDGSPPDGSPPDTHAGLAETGPGIAEEVPNEGRRRLDIWSG